MRGGEASTLRLVLTNLDLARAAALLLRGDETAEIRCAVAALHAKEDVMTPDLLVVDTSAVVITGEGRSTFATSNTTCGSTPTRSARACLALRGPIVIRGTFKAPVVSPSLGPVAARVGAAVGLGALAPPLAILPLIDLGNAEDVDCRALNEDARARTGTTERIRRPGVQSSGKAARKRPEQEVSNSDRPPV